RRALHHADVPAVPADQARARQARPRPRRLSRPVPGRGFGPPPASPLQSAVLILTVIQGPDKGKKFELPGNEPQLIGRSSEALPLTDTTVSRRHAELTPDPTRNAWYIRDLSSQNGTWVNGERITSRVRLKPGDQVRTGS